MAGTIPNQELKPRTELRSCLGLNRLSPFFPLLGNEEGEVRGSGRRGGAARRGEAGGCVASLLASARSRSVYQ